MTKEEHLARIVAKLKEYDEHPAGLTAADAIADELAELWAIVNVATSDSQIDGLWTLVERAQRAELAADAHAVELLKCEARGAEALRRAEDAEKREAWLRETGESVIAGLRSRNDALVDRLVRLHRAVTEEGASEKIVLILAEPEPDESTPAAQYPGLAATWAALDRAERAESMGRGLAATVARLERERDGLHAEVATLGDRLARIRAAAAEAYSLDAALDVIRAIATEPEPLDESKGPVTPRN